jgi:hypothetical protein
MKTRSCSRDTRSRNTRSTAGKTSVVPKKTNISLPRRGAKKKNKIDRSAETHTRRQEYVKRDAHDVRPSTHSSSSGTVANETTSPNDSSALNVSSEVNDESHDVPMSTDEATDAGPPLQSSPSCAVGDVNIPDAVNETALTHDSSTPHDSSMVDDDINSIVDIAVADDGIPSLTPPDSSLKEYYPERGPHTDPIDDKVAVIAAVEATAANAEATFTAPDYTAQANVDMDEDTLAKFVAARAVADANAATALATFAASDLNAQANVFMDDDDPALADWAGFPVPTV